jgi:hypothetical protein
MLHDSEIRKIHFLNPTKLGLLLKKNLDEEHRANLYQILANVTKNN